MKDAVPSALESLTLPYWHTVVAFGQTAVDVVLAARAWADKYPGIFKNLHTDDVPLKNRTALPGEILYEIAGRPECAYDFYEDESERLLYPSLPGKPPIAPGVLPPTRKIERRVALVKYGPYSLFKAADVGLGHRGE